MNSTAFERIFSFCTYHLALPIIFSYLNTNRIDFCEYSNFGMKLILLLSISVVLLSMKIKKNDLYRLLQSICCILVVNAQEEKRPVETESNHEITEVFDEDQQVIENTDVENKTKVNYYPNRKRKHWKKNKFMKENKHWKKHPACIKHGKKHPRCQRVRSRPSPPRHHYHHHHHPHHHHHGHRKPSRHGKYRDESYEGYGRHRPPPPPRRRQPDLNTDETPFNRNKPKKTTNAPIVPEQDPSVDVNENDVDFTTLAN